MNEFLGACREAQKAVDEGYDGIIVTHGTTTSEDTVYFLNLLVGGDIPIVLTNSQIQHMSVGNDEPQRSHQACCESARYL